MKQLIIFSVLALGFITVECQNKQINDPNAELRKINGSYHAIEVSSAINLYLSQSDNEAIAVSANDKNDIPKIITEVDNDGVLKIKLENSGKIYLNWKNKKFKVYVSFKNLDRISASGASTVFIEGILNGSSLDLQLHGASDLKGNLKMDNLNIQLSGASDVLLGGTANSVKIEASGASDAKAFNLSSDTCTAKASGASNISITVNKAFSIHASGASDINYKGSAIIKDMHSSGASSISKKG